jgi:HSP20 family protein
MRTSNFWFDSIFDDLTRTTSFPVDIWEGGDSYVYRAELAGVSKDDISVNVDDGILKITAERKDVERKTSYRKETFTGKMERSFYIPKDADVDNIDAGYQDGMLRLTVPKLEKYATRQIEIKSSS